MRAVTRSRSPGPVTVLFGAGPKLLRGPLRTRHGPARSDHTSADGVGAGALVSSGEISVSRSGADRSGDASDRTCFLDVARGHVMRQLAGKVWGRGLSLSFLLVIAIGLAVTP